MKFLANFDHSSILVIAHNFTRTSIKPNQINLWKKRNHKK
jgi:hypothetical protein